MQMHSKFEFHFFDASEFVFPSLEFIYFLLPFTNSNEVYSFLVWNLHEASAGECYQLPPYDTQYMFTYRVALEMRISVYNLRWPQQTLTIK